MEELDFTGLSGMSRDDPAMVAAWAQAEQLRDHDVIDINGQKLGRVTRCFAEDGALVRFDVTLSEDAKGVLGTQRDVASIPPIAIAEVDEKTVRLSEAAEQILDPGDPRPPQRSEAPTRPGTRRALHAREEARGAGGKPKKVR